ncbi:MAG: isoleucine--tRNA ligase [Nitrospinae bacterium]|nr:isoleucine--tRNA ligase [Nitrospinota bacterium]
MNYKETLNLLVTDFPMKANLVQKEPAILKQWETEDLYGRIRKASAGWPRYVFHDGPPYANGHIHMGHALNKLLKDFVVKIQSMKGFDTSFIPGWDCHGLPIEHQVGKELKKKKQDFSKSEIRKLCREYAAKFVDIQKEEFKRLGVFASWDQPYLTMDYSYEATIVREFTRFIEKDMVYKGLKPVHWCTTCRTALAEAEVEHDNHKSPSIYVKFPVQSGWKDQITGLDASQTYFVIWTTTPWTLPANLAICLHPDFEYTAVSHDGESWIVAKERVPALLEEWKLAKAATSGLCTGKDLEGVVCRHPFIDRESPVILGDHVTLEQGTGCVHTAPGHGQEDYIVGQKYGLDTYNPVDDAGIFKPEVEHFAGQFVTKANPNIIEKLRAGGFLVASSEIEHSYPHCWRCHQPIIFRATAQWFIPMDKNGLRAKALEEINKIRWVPHWGRERIYSMVENRPDWCVSRQRAWGVPITVVTCRQCDQHLTSPEVMSHIVKLVEQHGADFWFEKDVKELLPDGCTCPCGSAEFIKETDILDVWFDSGVSHVAVLENDPNQQWPADLYLEGSDQHRGWFHSSLLESVGTRSAAPYKTVLTHGYVVDGKGKKMSKSAGNVIAPQKIIDQYGAEILRLWVASENYREDIRISHEILKRLTEAYRKIRNTFRFLLGNLSDFDPPSDAVPIDDLEEIDHYILYRFRTVSEKILKAFEDFEFHTFYHSFYNFCIVDLSAFYLDIVKDRLYTYPKTSKGRRSSQTALYELLKGMAQLMAPILSFTSEEVWSYMPARGGEAASVHLSAFPDLSRVSFPNDLVDKWEKISQLKGEVSKALELRRQEKVIGHSLDARVQLELPGNLKKVLAAEQDYLKYIFIVSGVEIVDTLELNGDTYYSDTVTGLKINVLRALGKKCERCWNYFVEESAPEHPSVCLRCVTHLESAKA